MNTQRELWIMVDGVDHEIYVSNFGRVKNKSCSKNESGYILKPVLNNTGYYQVSLRVDKKFKRFLVHRLVAESFIPNPDHKPHVNHIDCDPTNNKAENLEWCTHKENLAYAAKLGRMPFGEKQHMSKLTNEKVLQVLELRKTCKTSVIAERFNVKYTAIDRILKGETWTRVTGIKPCAKKRKTA